MSAFRAFTGILGDKATVLRTAKAHLKADLLQHGATGNVNAGQQGCSVACTVGTYNHNLYPELLNMPAELGYLQDKIYEGMSQAGGADVRWTVDLLSAIPEGADVQSALYRIRARVLREVALVQVPNDEGVREAIEFAARLCDLDANGTPPTSEENSRCIDGAARTAWAVWAAEAAWAAGAAWAARAAGAAWAVWAAEAAWAAGAAEAASWDKIASIALEELARALPPQAVV